MAFTSSAPAGLSSEGITADLNTLESLVAFLVANRERNARVQHVGVVIHALVEIYDVEILGGGGNDTSKQPPRPPAELRRAWYLKDGVTTLVRRVPPWRRNAPADRRWPLGWMPPEKAPDPEGTQEQLSELCRAAAVAS